MDIVSLFSGAGGFDLGLVLAGSKIIWANDNDPDAVATYKRNIGNHIFEGDIQKIGCNQIPECDAIIGGFPCQGFSQANLLRFEDDPRNQLYLEFLRILKCKKPKYFLAENVRGLLSMSGGEAVKRIEEDFSEAGYVVSKRLFNVADYGVPQKRYRVIIAGTRKDIPLDRRYFFPDPTHSGSKQNLMVQPVKKWVTISEALKDIPEPWEEHNLTNHIFSKYKVTNRDFTGHRKTDPDRPSPTILARGDGKGGVCAIQHPNNHRRMSVREQAIIQTFPLDFIFEGRMNSCYRQVGNAVPVLFAKALGEKLIEANRGGGDRIK